MSRHLWEKTNILKQFNISLSKSEMSHFLALDNMPNREIKIDNYARTLLKRKLGAE